MSNREKPKAKAKVSQTSTSGKQLQFRSKSTSSLPQKLSKSARPTQSATKSKPKGIVELAKVEESTVLPPYYVKRNTAVPAQSLTSKSSIEREPAPPLTENLLDEPRFQSSLAVLEALERFKRINFDGHDLLQQNTKVLSNVHQKAAVATNINPKTVIFRELEPLNVNREELIVTEESRRRQIARQIAPKFPKIKNEDPKLSDFVQPYKPALKPSLPNIKSFPDELRNWGINPLEPARNRAGNDDLFVYDIIA